MITSLKEGHDIIDTKITTMSVQVSYQMQVMNLALVELQATIIRVAGGHSDPSTFELQ